MNNSNWNENKIKFLTRNKKRASLVPAAAVIPAPRVYIHVAAVKMFVVEYKCRLIMLNNRRMI